MIIDPINQTKLYGLKNQFYEIINLYNRNKLPNKILLTGPKGVGKSTLAFHLINYIFSKNEEKTYDIKDNNINYQNKSFKLLHNGTHPNFHLIDVLDDNKFIEISQIRKMILYTNKSSFDNRPKIILINNVERLNKNSVNALLKITEEPNDNIYFIFIHDSNKKILKTLTSRCIYFKINLSFDSTIEITNHILDQNIVELINSDFLSYYYTPGNFVNLVNFSKKNNINLKTLELKKFLSFLIDGNYYKIDSYIKVSIYDFIELYFLKIFINSNFKNSIMSLYENFTTKIHETNQFNLDKESLFMEFKLKILNE